MKTVRRGDKGGTSMCEGRKRTKGKKKRNVFKHNTLRQNRGKKYE